MMRLVNQDQLKSGRVIFRQAISRRDALHACDGDLGKTSRMLLRHLDVYGLVGIQLSDMAGRLLYQLPAVCEHESLRRFWPRWRYAVDEMAEDDGFATAGREGKA